MSLFWAVCLRMREVASVQLLSELNGFSGIPSEIYARLLILRQLGSIEGEMGTRPIYETLGRESIFAYDAFQEVFGVAASGGLSLGPTTFLPEPDWVGAVRKVLRLRTRAGYEFRRRSAPRWNVFSHVKKGVTVAEIGKDVVERLLSLFADFNPAKVDGVERVAIRSTSLVNAVPHAILKQAQNLLEAVEGTRDPPQMMIPLDSHVVLVGKQSIIALASECGVECFDAERALMEVRHQNEAEVFHYDTECIWADTIDDSRFEDLIGELLLRERGMHRLRQVGATREGDDGRDFMADWSLTPFTGPVVGVSKGEVPLNMRMEVLIQVKLRKRGVSRSDVPNLRDTLEHYDCAGLLVVAFPRVTTQLFDHLREMRRRGQFWVDWWGKPEIEHRLRRNSDLAARYSDVVRLERAVREN